MAKTTTKTQAARKTTKTEKLATQRPMATAIDLSADSEDAAIGALLAELSGEIETSDEIAIESTIEASDDAVGDIRAGEVSADDLDAALASAEATSDMLASATIEVADGTVTGDASDVEPDAEGKPKKERTPRVHYANKADRIAARLGDKLAEYTVLTVNDAAGALDEAALVAKMADTMTLIRGMSKKKQNRASFLMEFVSGKSAKLNEVMSRTLQVLNKDGVLTTGKDGNLLANLLARPYSPAAARAMGTNTVSVLEDLKLIVADGKGTYRANPDSLLLAKANALLGISTAS